MEVQHVQWTLQTIRLVFEYRCFQLSLIIFHWSMIWKLHSIAKWFESFPNHYALKSILISLIFQLEYHLICCQNSPRFLDHKYHEIFFFHKHRKFFNIRYICHIIRNTRIIINFSILWEKKNDLNFISFCIAHLVKCRAERTC